MEWLQGVIAWAQAHPGLSLAAIFFISILECAVFIGLFLPGAGILFCIGTLVSLGALPFGPAMAVITAGGLIGDVLSYELGRRYGQALFRRPFLARRPLLMEKGSAFFRRHGGKGLVMAQMIGPLRPLMPAIAGAYGLPRARFLAAIVPAVVVWTLLYALPGVAFGASLGLAAEVTKRLAIVLLFLAVTLWIALWITRKAVIVLGRNAEKWLNAFTDWSHRHGPIGRIGAFADPRQPELPALLSLALVLLLIGAIALAATWALGGRPPAVDLYAHEAMQNLQDPWGIQLAAIALLPGDPLVYGTFAALLALVMVLKQRWDVFRHLLVAFAFGLVLSFTLTSISGLSPADAIELHLLQDLALPITIYGLVPVLFGGGATINRRIVSYGLATVLLLFLILARLYLGGVWLTVGLATVLIALVWTAGVGVSFRRHGSADLPIGALWPALIVLVVALGIDSRQFRPRMQAALPEIAPRPMTTAQWWAEDWKKLPARRVDLTGRDKQFLNLQWAGPLLSIRETLRQGGWESPQRLTFATGLRWLATSSQIAELPLMPRMHGGHYAVLTMRHGLDDDRQLLIRLWPAGYVLDGASPLWIGTITSQTAGEFFRLLRYPVSQDSYTAALGELDAPGFEPRDVQRSPGSLTIRLLRPQPPP